MTGIAQRSSVAWPAAPAELESLQLALAERAPAPWRPHPGRELVVGGVFVAGPTGLVGNGARGDPLWAAAVAMSVGKPSVLAGVAVRGSAGAPYAAGFLAAREGPLIETTARSLAVRPSVLLVNGTGRDHPRRAGIAVHVGSVLQIPTVGVTVRPLVAAAAEPALEYGAAVPLVLGSEIVGAALRTRRGARPVYAHAAWRTNADTARAIVLLATNRYRTPDPIRLARRLARQVRARDEGRAPSGGEA